MAAGCDAQKPAGRYQIGAQACELAIAARAGFEVLAGAHKGRRIAGDHVEELPRRAHFLEFEHGIAAPCLDAAIKSVVASRFDGLVERCLRSVKHEDVACAVA